MRFCFLTVAVAALALSCNAAFPGETDELVESLSICSSQISADVACVTRLKDGLENAKSQVEKVRSLKDRMKQIDDGFKTLSNINKLVKYAPGIGSFVNAIDKVLKAVKAPFSQAYSMVKRIDSTVYPFKAKCETGIKRVDQAIKPMDNVKGVCEKGESYLNTVRRCVQGMKTGSLTTSLKGSLEQFGKSLNPSFDVLLLGMGRVAAGCRKMDSFINAVKQWPDFNRILKPITNFQNKLKPILSFFDQIQDVLNKRVCVPLPDIKKLDPRRWGRRRRSSLHLVEKRDLCFSVQKIIDGVNGVIGSLVKKANQLIDKLIDKIPKPDLPGMPDFSDILKFNLNIKMPDVNLNMDQDLFSSFNPLKWDCVTQVTNVCQKGAGSVTFNCGKGLGSY